MSSCWGRARAVGGVLFAVTPTLNPGDLDTGELRRAGRCSDTGRVGGPARSQTSAAAALPAPPADLAPALEPRPPVHRQAHPPRSRRLTDDQAKSWAARIISRGGPLTWEPVDDGRPRRGWQVRDHASGLVYVIRRHPDGWKLVQVCGHATRERAETDNEARAWAAGVAATPGRHPGRDLAAAPSTPGSLTSTGSPGEPAVPPARRGGELRGGLRRRAVQDGPVPDGMGAGHYQADDAVQAAFARA